MHSTTSKSDLRKLLRERRRAIGGPERQAAAANVAARLDQLPPPAPGSRVALYLPADGELDPRPLALRCRDAGCELYLPVVHSGGIMQFALWQRDAALVVNRYGIAEPGPEYPRLGADTLDLVFMPLVGWDGNGARLGMGGGFYDRALADVVGLLKVGIGFECQRVERLVTDAWDIALDYVVTEAALHRCREED